MILYDYPASSNCMKVRILLQHLGIPYERVTVDLFRGETRNDAHFARNPDGRVPTLELEDGTTISESGAILLFLAERTIYLPEDPVARARVHQWMFFEQNRIEAELATRGSSRARADRSNCRRSSPTDSSAGETRSPRSTAGYPTDGRS